MRPTASPAGRALRVFGDKFQISKVVGGQRYWRVPVMEGEFLLQESFGMREAGHRRRQLPDPRRGRRQRARRRRGRRGRDRGHARRHPAVSGRRRAERQQDRLARLHVADRVHQRRLLPDAAADDGLGAAGGRELGARARARRARAPTRSAARCASASTRRAVPACARSPRATTAATSARTIFICARSWPETAPHERQS